MSTETLRPTTVTTPSAGGGSCSGSAAARNCTADSECATGIEKATADHKNFASPTYQGSWTSAVLKIAWKVDAQGGTEDDCSAEVVYYKVSTNGSTFSTVLTKTPSGSNQTGTYSYGLSTSQDISKVQVRIDAQATATSCGTGRCCYGTSGCDCAVMTQAQCTTNGGIWTSGADCNGDPCWKPICGGA